MRIGKQGICAMLGSLCALCACVHTPVQREASLLNQNDNNVREHRMQVEIDTSMGVIQVTLAAEQAPKTVANFLTYVRSGHYTDTIFHRVMDGFMIQGGGFTVDMQQKPADNCVENEASNGLSNRRGTLAMARTSDPHSASAQFFINVNDNLFLDYPGQDGWGYCVFGEVAAGMEVVEQIKGVATGNAGMHQNVPLEPVVIYAIREVVE